MVDRQQLLSDLQKLLQKLEADLLERSMSAEVPEVGVWLKEEHERATKAQRTAQNYEDWRTDAITQAAAAWVLSCVFVRFLEDNRLIDPPKISGPASGGSGQSEDRLDRARDEHELYFRKHPKQTDREYLLSIFDQLAKLPGTKDVFGEHNPMRELPNWLSGDAAGELLKFFQKIDASTGALVHDFTDSNWDTRFLGDLYQDLSEAARKKYALLQTPDFVEEFILDRTLEPALDEFTLTPSPPSGGEGRGEGADRYFKMIDPACGSGHFLLGSFPRILERWMKKEPGTNVRELVQRTLDSIYGVDVNPFAIAIARFRLLLAALRACGIQRLADAPAFEMNLVCGDSLLHAPLASGGKKYTAGQQELDFALAGDLADSDECDHAYRSENLPELKRLLRGGQYHAVVANPPYIRPQDEQLNASYRRRFLSCQDKYALTVPFMEQLFRLALRGERSSSVPKRASGFVGQITANSFAKADFGKKLVEKLLPTIHIDTVVDTSGSDIPGHATPTMILFGRNCTQLGCTLRLAASVHGSKTSDEVTNAAAWTSLVEHISTPGYSSNFVTITDADITRFHRHPWSLGDGSITGALQQLNDLSTKLRTLAPVIGRITHTGEDCAFYLPIAAGRRLAFSDWTVPVHSGEDIRDYEIQQLFVSVFPYDSDTANPIQTLPVGLKHFFWPQRTVLRNRRDWDQTPEDRGLRWFDHTMFFPDRYVHRNCLAYAEITTHVHCIERNSRNLFDRTAPVIQFSHSDTNASAISAILNSSTACFWGHHTLRQKTGASDNSWEKRYVWNATNLKEFPIPIRLPAARGKMLSRLSAALAKCSPVKVLAAFAPTVSLESNNGNRLRDLLGSVKSERDDGREELTAAQEELDWECYWLYGLVADDLTMPEPPPIKLGQRAFEIVLARKMAASETETTWFERHGSTPITELPAEWPDDYRQLVERRIALIESDPNIRLIEQPEYKRRWNTEPWESQLERALREWLLNRLEGYFDFDGRMREGEAPAEPSSSMSSTSASPGSSAGASPSQSPPLAEIQLVSVARLASVAGQDADFLQVGELYRDDPAFDVQALVTELVAPECVPLLPVLRYKPAGLIKRTTWERTWDLQRQEDTIDARTQLPGTDPNYLTDDAAKALKEKQVGKIPVPTKYDSKDFLTSDFWRLRGKLDVPKERWISFPHCDGPDGTMMLCWAGYDHLQQARAISAYYVQVQTEFGGSDDPRLIPLLACLIELLPWLKQWHNELDPEFNMSMGDYFEGFINEEARQLGKTLQEIREWMPPAKTPARRSRKSR